MTSTENVTDIVPVEPHPSEGLNARRIAKYSDFGPIEGYILETVSGVAIGIISGGTKFSGSRGEADDLHVCPKIDILTTDNAITQIV